MKWNEMKWNEMKCLLKKQHTCIHNMVPTSLYIRQQLVFSGKLNIKFKAKLKLIM